MNSRAINLNKKHKYIPSQNKLTGGSTRNPRRGLPLKNLGRCAGMSSMVLISCKAAIAQQ